MISMSLVMWQKDDGRGRAVISHLIVRKSMPTILALLNGEGQAAGWAPVLMTLSVSGVRAP